MLSKILTGLTKVTNIKRQQETIIDLRAQFLKLVLGSCVSTVFLGVKENTFILGANHIYLSNKASPAQNDINVLIQKLSGCTELICLGVFGGASSTETWPIDLQGNQVPPAKSVGDNNLKDACTHLAELGYKPFLPISITTGYRATFSFTLIKAKTLKVEIDLHVTPGKPDPKPIRPYLLELPDLQYH